VATQHQIRSNRQNAQESTGPRTQKTPALPDSESRRTSGKGPSTPSFSPNPSNAPALPTPTSPKRERRGIQRTGTIEHQESRIEYQAPSPICPTNLFLRALASSWQKFALDNCRVRSTNRPFMRKTNPISKTKKTTQPLMPHRFTTTNHPSQTKKNKPKQTQHLAAKPGPSTPYPAQFTTHPSPFAPSLLSRKHLSVFSLSSVAISHSRKTNPISSTLESMQPLLRQRVMNKSRTHSPRKNKPNLSRRSPLAKPDQTQPIPNSTFSILNSTFSLPSLLLFPPSPYTHVPMRHRPYTHVPMRHLRIAYCLPAV